MSLPLPRSLKIEGDRLRKDLLKTTAEAGIRVVLDLADGGQAFPHVGVMLLGREIIGWVFGMSQDVANADGDDVFERVRYSLVPQGGRIDNFVFHSEGQTFPASLHFQEDKQRRDQGSKWFFRESTFSGLFSRDDPLKILRVHTGAFGDPYLNLVQEFRDHSQFKYLAAC